MILEEYFTYRDELLEQAKDDEGFIQESLLLAQVLPSMLDAKLIDSEDYNTAYFKSIAEKLKMNAYCVNESGERLQLFMINEASIDLSAKENDLQVSTKSVYDAQFKRATSFANKAIKGHLNDEIQDSSPAKALISKMSSSEGAHQFDVIEIFLITTTSTVSIQGAKPQPKRIEFPNEEITITYTKNREKKKKTILIKKRLIDLNFLYNIVISQGNREALRIDFEAMFNQSLHALKAADEEHFESYLCVLPASIISGLYKEYSTRLLEKNVRSFLQFKGVNKGIRETIRKEPEKFFAYNNGLTITATSAEISTIDGQKHITSLTDFQIVNGGQTTATIYFTQKDGFDISKVKVMAKINVAKETSSEDLEELISNISTFSNAQSRVSKVDLRSRNPQLVIIKSLSESIITPSGLKWFFERAKGEYNTKLRIAGANKARYKKEFPNERRFSKEQMAKYYCAWDDKPYMVKKGGEKIFRYFIEKLCGEGEFKKAINVNRDFYEELISKIIIFRKLEKLYGQGKNSMGQLRSAVVPYTISTLFSYTDGNKKNFSFDLIKIWMSEGLDGDLESFFTSLLKKMNDLIKSHSDSDDFGEFSKKQELWDRIINSVEIKELMTSPTVISLLSKYGISKEELKKRKGLNEKQENVDFKPINDNVLIHSNGEGYYKLILTYSDIISNKDERKLSTILTSIINKTDIDNKLIEYEKEITNKFRINNPAFFDTVSREQNKLYDTLNFIINTYNQALNNNRNILSEFEKIESIGKAKNIKYISVFNQIGKQLVENIPPTINQLHLATNFFKKKSDDLNESSLEKVDVKKIKLNEFVLRKMFEWDSKVKILSTAERTYVADFAWGLKKLTPFHSENIRRHLTKILAAGFKL